MLSDTATDDRTTSVSVTKVSGLKTVTKHKLRRSSRLQDGCRLD